ncbi:S41 family peptidase [Roseivirga sp. BDSF3-8]|uniref:S41 family peptidase n=1 Tax=Roseivirga sp. BDSF3-8 TaxID=3241598 RepID=UPI003531F322
MKKTLLLSILFTFAYLTLAAQSQPAGLDSIQTERLAKTCELWGHLNYFHPDLDDGSIDWAGAFTDNIGLVKDAKNSREYGEAVQRMLSRLNDPATLVVTSEARRYTGDSVKYPVVEFVEDSVLLFSINDYSDLEDYNYVMTQLKRLTESIPLSKGVIFDIRSAENPGMFKGYVPWYFNMIENYFSSEVIEIPGLQARFHDGFAPESGATSGGYESGYYITNQKTITPAPEAVDRPIVFIVNEHTDMPRVVAGLYLGDKARIVSTSPITEAVFAETITFELDDSLTVSIRTNELLTDRPIKEHVLLPKGTEKQQMVGSALSLINHTPEQVNVVGDAKETSRFAAGDNQVEESSGDYPDEGHRLLAAAKIWTVIHYFFAYQDLMTKDWDKVLREYIPRFVSASDSLGYHMAVAAMYTNIEDGHGFAGSKTLNAYLGPAAPPIKVRYIEGQPVIVDLLPDSLYKHTEVNIGDIVLAVDGEAISDRFERYATLTASSNDAYLRGRVAHVLLNGQDGTEASLVIQKADGRTARVSLRRDASYNRMLWQLGNGRNEQPIIRLINKDIGYADLDRLTKEMVDSMFDVLRDTKAIIFDMRGYPKGTAWSIAPYLTEKNGVYAASFRRYSPMKISVGGTGHQTFFDQPIPPSKGGRYKGKTVMLIDERTMSQAEHTGLFLEAANGTTFIGSQTAGANGDVTKFRVPGNIILAFTGHDVRHIDGRQLQKIGLVPDIEVKPTIGGIRAGKDEVLQKAIDYVQGEIGE